MTEDINRLLDVIASATEYDYYVEGADRVAKLLVDAMMNNHHIVIDPDSDVDGALSVLQFTDLFNALGYRNFSVVKVKEKRHGIDGVTITTTLAKNAKLLIVVDSSSDKIETMNNMCEGTPDLKIIHVDHHVPSNVKFHPNIVSINNHSLPNFSYKDVSCGLLSYLVLKPMFDKLSMKLSKEMESLAYATVITDVVPMSSDALIKFMTVAKANTIVHPLLSTFMVNSGETKLSREFVTFQFSPKINAIYRTNKLYVLDDLIFKPNYRHTLSSYTLHNVYNVHKESTSLKSALVPDTPPEKYGDFLFTDITETANQLGVSTYVARNYTGLIASEIGNKYKMPSICIIQQGGSVKGSVRDYYGRNLLYPVSNYLNAAGHKPAFGFTDSMSAYKKFQAKCDNHKVALLDSFKKDICVDLSDMLVTSLTEFIDKINTY